MTGPDIRAVPNARYAFQVLHPGSPVLRMRYRAGVVMGPHGFPDWVRSARAVVELPPPLPDLGMDELRVSNVLIANELMAGTGDPLWRVDGPTRTPAGWTWAHVGMTLRVALVPIELHGAFRHLGGMSTLKVDRGRRGITAAVGTPVELISDERVDERALAKVEDRIGYRFPAGYRDFLLRTNGGSPAEPVVHPRFGFVADQRLFGLARQDRMQDLLYVNAWLRDRLTGDFLAIGYVQGGLLAVQVRGADAGSVWYLDDDDYRDDDSFRAEDVCAQLLHRCADTFEEFTSVLLTVPERLRRLARAAVSGGFARRVAPPELGTGLPAAKRSPLPAPTDDA